MYQRAQEKQDAEIDRAATEVRRFELEIKYRAASRLGELNARGWPVTVDPTWFDGEAPRNNLLSPEHPWVEVATIEQAELQHPPVRMAVTNELAGLWYNPFQGIVRARVPVMVSDNQAVKIYNRINDCALASIFQTEGSLLQPEAPKAKPKEGDEKAEDKSADSADSSDDKPKLNHVEVTATGRIKRPTAKKK